MRHVQGGWSLRKKVDLTRRGSRHKEKCSQVGVLWEVTVAEPRLGDSGGFSLPDLRPKAGGILWPHSFCSFLWAHWILSCYFLWLHKTPDTHSLEEQGFILACSFQRFFFQSIVAGLKAGRGGWKGLEEERRSHHGGEEAEREERLRGGKAILAGRAPRTASSQQTTPPQGSYGFFSVGESTRWPSHLPKAGDQI